MDEATLGAKLRKIEALYAGTTSDGEREAALQVEGFDERVVYNASKAYVNPMARDEEPLGLGDVVAPSAHTRGSDERRVIGSSP